MRNDRRESIERGRVGAQWRGKHKARPVSNDVISLVSQRVNNYGLSQAFQVGPQDPSLFLSCSLISPFPPAFFTRPSRGLRRWSAAEAPTGIAIG